MAKKKTPAERKPFTQEDAQRLNEQQFEKYKAAVAEATTKQIPLLLFDTRHMKYEKVHEQLGTKEKPTLFDALGILLENMQNMGMCKFMVLSDYREYERAHHQEPGTEQPKRTPRKKTKTGA